MTSVIVVVLMIVLCFIVYCMGKIFGAMEQYEHDRQLYEDGKLL